MRRAQDANVRRGMRPIKWPEGCQIPATALFMVFGLLLTLASPAIPAEEWTRFRGPNGTGISTLQGVPVEWTEDDYEWIVNLPGKGHSSPVIWGEQLFVASGDENGERMLICLDATTGKDRWVQTLHIGPRSKITQKNSFGSGTPVTDGERVYVSFAADDRYSVLAFDAADGSPLWSEDLGTFTSSHGLAHSPILAGELLIVTCDQKGPSFVAALESRTGAEVWRSPRTERKAAYSTPMILNGVGQKPRLICLSGATGVAGIDLETGTELWASGEMPLRTVASPVAGDGVIIASCGSGGQGKYMAAVEPPAASHGGEARIRWERKTVLPYVPTPIISGSDLFLWTDQGIVCRVDLQSSETVERIRVGGTYSGSPVLIDGRLYCPAEDGTIAVVATTPKLAVLGKSPLGDRIHSTPAVANGRVYFRGFHTLACLKAKELE